MKTFGNIVTKLLLLLSEFYGIFFLFTFKVERSTVLFGPRAPAHDASARHQNAECCRGGKNLRIILFTTRLVFRVSDASARLPQLGADETVVGDHVIEGTVMQVLVA